MVALLEMMQARTPAADIARSIDSADPTQVISTWYRAIPMIKDYPDKAVIGLALNRAAERAGASRWRLPKPFWTAEIKPVPSVDKAKRTSGMHTYAVWQLDEVFSRIGQQPVVANGILVDFDSIRYKLFRRCMVCVRCGLVGRYFKQQALGDAVKSHFNLFAVNSSGREVLMTRDHILPQSRGGKDVLENLQTMCVHCNGRKSDKVFGIMDHMWNGDREQRRPVRVTVCGGTTISLTYVGQKIVYRPPAYRGNHTNVRILSRG